MGVWVGWLLLGMVLLTLPSEVPPVVCVGVVPEHPTANTQPSKELRTATLDFMPESPANGRAWLDCSPTLRFETIDLALITLI
jgi:hypothetical protein